MTKFEQLMKDLQVDPHSAAWNDHTTTWNTALSTQATLDTKEHPLHHVGVALVLYDDDYTVLLQHRRKDFGHGKFVLTGGTLDEANPEEGIIREVKEELGYDLDPKTCGLEPLWFANDQKSDGSPYLMMYYRAFVPQSAGKGAFSNMEPDKCYGVHWYQMGALANLDMWANDRRAIDELYWRLSR